MATAGAIIGLRVPDVEVEDIETTSKTLPGFSGMWEQMLVETVARNARPMTSPMSESVLAKAPARVRRTAPSQGRQVRHGGDQDRGRWGVALDDGPLVTAMRARELGRTAVGWVTVGVVGDTTGRKDTLARIVKLENRTSVLRRTADDTDLMSASS